jgi:diguanylate cyclase (GGDEF)-like protein
MFISLNDIPNKKDFEQNLIAQMEGGRTVSLIFVDQDGFKQVNRPAWHPEGDRCLMESAAAMSKVLDDRGLLYRPGGDESLSLVAPQSRNFWDTTP